MRNGIPVIATCDGCSGCCRERSVPPFEGIGDPEFLALPETLREGLLPLLEQERNDTVDSVCAWLDPETQRCRHYELRPVACRSFERGSFYCLQFRRKWAVPDES